MDLNKIYSKGFGWMFFGLLVTFLTVYINNNFIIVSYALETINFLCFVSTGMYLTVSYFLIRKIHETSYKTAKIYFLVLSVLTGYYYSAIFTYFELSSIIYVFAITALLFGIFALLGHFTKIDLSKMATSLIMGGFIIFICMYINIFLGNTIFDLIIAIMIVIFYLANIIYNIQAIKKEINELYEGNEDNLAIFFTSSIYLNFYYILLFLLDLLKKIRRIKE